MNNKREINTLLRVLYDIKDNDHDDELYLENDLVQEVLYETYMVEIDSEKSSQLGIDNDSINKKIESLNDEEKEYIYRKINNTQKKGKMI